MTFNFFSVISHEQDWELQVNHQEGSSEKSLACKKKMWKHHKSNNLDLIPIWSKVTGPMAAIFWSHKLPSLELNTCASSCIFILCCQLFPIFKLKCMFSRCALSCNETFLDSSQQSQLKDHNVSNYCLWHVLLCADLHYLTLEFVQKKNGRHWIPM